MRSLNWLPWAALVTGVVSGACSDDGPGTPDAQNIAFDRQAMLANIGENIILPVYRSFDAEADELATRVDAYCSALGTADEEASLAAAQEQWRATMSEWQVAEVMLFGPAAMNDQTLRDRIYSWPVTSTCAVDQDVMARYNEPADYDVGARLNNRRGLDALEHLLFSTSLETTCPPQTAPAGWADLADAEKRAARCALARDVAADVAAQAQVAVDAWDPDKGDYLGELAGAGTASSSFESAQAAVNVVSDALFYIDTEVKDMKLGQAAGITMNQCNTVQEPCPAELEFPIARFSKDSAASNVRGLEMLFRGGGPEQDPDAAGALGFADFLRAAGAEDLADTMRADIAEARSAIEGVPGTLADALVNDYDSVVQAHAELRDVTTQLKSQFLTVLGLDFPDGAAGDND